ncbi:50S ribosomal protein L22 [Candidatus Woesearchaeota archaeon]|nr:50S ribosomal protein L22 [Candidatus Woesearchaeota archaeon]
MENQDIAIVNGKNLPISTKKSVEICNLIRSMSTKKAKAVLNRVILMKEAVPYRRYNDNTSHRPGIGPGKYPIKTSKEILRLVESAEANAQNRGLSTNLVIEHISANKAPLQWHYGRKRRRKQKNTHLKIIVKELKIKKDDRKANTKKEN